MGITINGVWSRKDLQISNEVTDYEGDQNQTRHRHEEFASDGRTKQIARQAHRGEWRDIAGPVRARQKNAARRTLQTAFEEK